MAHGSDEQSTPGLDVEDVAGSVAARRALGPDAEDAVIRAFLERTGAAIDARVEQRIAEREGQQLRHVASEFDAGYLPATPPPPRPVESGPDRTPLVLALCSLVAGVPLSGIATQFGRDTWGPEALIAMVIIWAGIALINIVYNRRH